MITPKKNRFYTLISPLLLIFVPLTSGAITKPTTTPLVLGSIQFPHNITSVPVPRVYCMGKTIPCEVHEGAKKVTFDLPKNKNLRHFYLLVTESINYKLKKSDYLKQQTIEYIYIPKNKSYKIYELELALLDSIDAEQEEKHHWIVTEKELATDEHRIPDETIIVLYSPDYVEKVTGGNLLELPTIVIKPDVVNLAGSAENLFEESIKLQLASLNSDTIHSPLKLAVKQIGQRTLIAPTA